MPGMHCSARENETIYLLGMGDITSAYLYEARFGCQRICKRIHMRMRCVAGTKPLFRIYTDGNIPIFACVTDICAHTVVVVL